MLIKSNLLWFSDLEMDQVVIITISLAHKVGLPAISALGVVSTSQISKTLYPSRNRIDKGDITQCLC